MTATRATVLVVEDDPSSADMLQRLLARHEFEVETAATAGEALVKLEGEALPAAVILDLHLPDASGGVVLRRIRRSRLPVKVAIITGMPDPSAFADLLNFPADALFQKPFDQRELMQWLTGA
jgi:two-component system, OmpR family, response regulator